MGTQDEKPALSKAKGESKQTDIRSQSPSSLIVTPPLRNDEDKIRRMCEYHACHLSYVIVLTHLVFDKSSSGEKMSDVGTSKASSTSCHSMLVDDDEDTSEDGDYCPRGYGNACLKETKVFVLTGGLVSKSPTSRTSNRLRASSGKQSKDLPSAVRPSSNQHSPAGPSSTRLSSKKRTASSLEEDPTLDRSADDLSKGTIKRFLLFVELETPDGTCLRPLGCVCPEFDHKVSRVPCELLQVGLILQSF